VDRRRYVNAFLVVWLVVLGVEAFRPAQAVDRAIHPALDVTGLRQFPWRLFAEVPRVNLRFAAKLEYADGTTARWDSPEWRDASVPHKFLAAREMNYFRNLNLFDDEAFPEVASGLCAYLARTMPGPSGPARTVTLFLTGARIPDIDERRVPAEPFAEFDQPIPIFGWKAP
jgi:hypothetical protein